MTSKSESIFESVFSVYIIIAFVVWAIMFLKPESKPPAKKSNKNKTKVEAANPSMNNQEEKNVSDADGDLEDKKHI